MIDKQVAKKMATVLDKQTLDALIEWAEDRIAQIHLSMEYFTEMKDIYSAQGRIAEMRRIKTLRAEVEQEIKE